MARKKEDAADNLAANGDDVEDILNTNEGDSTEVVKEETFGNNPDTSETDDTKEGTMDETKSGPDEALKNEPDKNLTDMSDEKDTKGNGEKEAVLMDKKAKLASCRVIKDHTCTILGQKYDLTKDTTVNLPKAAAIILANSSIVVKR